MAIAETITIRADNNNGVGVLQIQPIKIWLNWFSNACGFQILSDHFINRIFIFVYFFKIAARDFKSSNLVRSPEVEVLYLADIHIHDVFVKFIESGTSISLLHRKFLLFAHRHSDLNYQPGCGL